MARRPRGRHLTDAQFFGEIARIEAAADRYNADEKKIATGHYVERLDHRSRRDGSIPMHHAPKEDRPRCGALTRKGTPCQRLPVEGKKRCINHGGASTGPRSEAGRAAIAESNRRRAAKRAAAKQAE